MIGRRPPPTIIRRRSPPRSAMPRFRPRDSASELCDVPLTEETVRELVGTAELGRFRDLEELRDELICLLFNAVVGTSRLPLAPAETPLPAFSFGELFYCYRVAGPCRPEPLGMVEELVQVMCPVR